jgi:hypothetical protein
MSIGMLILVLWVGATAAYLIWQFASGALTRDEQTLADLGQSPRPATPLPARRARPTFRHGGRLLPMPVMARSRATQVRRRSRA